MPETIQWKTGRETDFKNWILEELTTARSEGDEMRDNWMRWIRRYENDKKQTSTAWEGSANLRVPITQIGVDAVYARMMNTIFATEELYNINSLFDDKDFQRLSKAVQKYLNYNLYKQNRFRREYGNTILGCLKLGTDILKTPHVRTTRRDRVQNSKGIFESTDIETFNGPQLCHVSVFDFLIRGMSIQKADWVAHRTRMRWGQIQQRVFEGKWPKKNVAKIHGLEVGDVPEHQIDLESIIGYDRLIGRDYEIQEVWADFDVDGDGREEPIVCWVLEDPGVIIHSVYNWYRPALRPFRAFRYIRREDSFWGKGIPELLRYIQDEIDTIHDQRIDNGTLSNMKMFKARKGSGVTPKTKVYPGKMFMLTNVDDLISFDLGDKGADSLPHERMALEYAQLSLGLSDYNLGRESPGMASRATATSTIALIQQGQNRFDLTIDEHRDELVELAYDVLDRARQFGIADYVLDALRTYAEDLEEFVKLPLDQETREAFAVLVTPTSAKANREVDKQNQVSLLGLYGQFAERLFGIFQLILSPEAPPEIKQLATQVALGMQNILKKIFDAYSIPDASAIIPDLEQMIGQTDAGSRDLQAAIENTGVQGLSAVPPGGAAPSPESAGVGAEEPQRGVFPIAG